MEIAWSLLFDGNAVDVFDVDPVTRRLTLRKRLKFTRRLTAEEALRVVNTNFPKTSENVRLAAETLGRLKGR